MFTLIWALVSLLGFVYLILMTRRSGFRQNSIKSLSKGLIRQKEVFKAYEEVNSLPPAPKAAVVKRLRNISAGADAMPELSKAKRKRS